MSGVGGSSVKEINAGKREATVAVIANYDARNYMTFYDRLSSTYHVHFYA